jgi:hypothetical protein
MKIHGSRYIAGGLKPRAMAEGVGGRVPVYSTLMAIDRRRQSVRRNPGGQGAGGRTNLAESQFQIQRAES